MTNNEDGINEIIIHMVRAEPIIYNKADSNYLSNIEKKQKFEIIPSAIFQYYQEIWSGICYVFLSFDMFIRMLL